MPIDPALREPAPAELGHAGAVVDKAIEYMVGQNISSLAIASRTRRITLRISQVISSLQSSHLR